MLCTSPAEFQIGFRPCGLCPNCRINKKRIWSSRIQLESLYHAQSVFITLTYEDDTVPLNLEHVPTLRKTDLREFINKLRREYSSVNSTFRFFGCGEYGEQTHRPHLHIILFGVGLEAEPLINKIWEKGFTQVGELLPEHCSYIAGYCLKKMTMPEARGLRGRDPEFSGMSTRPGLGYQATIWLKHLANNPKNLQTIRDTGDVWNSIRIGGKIWPLGRYLRSKLRGHLGLSNDATQRAIQLDRVHINTGEIIIPPPLPEDYSPWQDIADYQTPRTIYDGKKEKIADLPQINHDADHRERQKTRRKTYKTETV